MTVDLSKSYIGDACELAVAAWYTWRGYQTALASGLGKVDLMVSADDGAHRVQVKKASPGRGRPDLRSVLQTTGTSGGKRKQTSTRGDSIVEYDLLVMVDTEQGYLWEIPVTALSGCAVSVFRPGTRQRPPRAAEVSRGFNSDDYLVGRLPFEVFATKYSKSE